MQQIRQCRIAGGQLETIIDFGMQPLGNGFLPQERFSEEYFFPMKVGFCETSCMFQLVEQPAPNKMFHHDYPFFSSTSSVMEEHFQEFAAQILSGGKKRDGFFVIELGCNDGILLKNMADRGCRHLGIEPAANVAEIARSRGVKVVSEFFDNVLTDNVISKFGQADVFCAANVMCHISDIRSVAKNIQRLLKPEGVLIFEDPYLGDVIDKTAYDQVYDEHVFIFSAHSVQYLFNLEGLELIDVERQSTHGGSMRYTLARRGVFPIRKSVSELMAQEKEQGLDKVETFRSFAENVQESRKEFRQLLTSLRSKGKRIAGYAASSKSTTVLNYCSIGPETIEQIFDSTPSKQGKFSPGQHIPIAHSEMFRTNPPDYAVVLAWNHLDEISRKERKFIENGGRWIVHLPRARVIE